MKREIIGPQNYRFFGPWNAGVAWFAMLSTINAWRLVVSWRAAGKFRGQMTISGADQSRRQQFVLAMKRGSMDCSLIVIPALVALSRAHFPKRNLSHDFIHGVSGPR